MHVNSALEIITLRNKLEELSKQVEELTAIVTELRDGSCSHLFKRVDVFYKKCIECGVLHYEPEYDE